MSAPETLPIWLPRAQVKSLSEQHGSPLYVYSSELLRQQAAAALDLPAPYGLTVRYAMKANPQPEILRIFRKLGLHLDASSGYEAENALQAGFEPNEILLTAQELPQNLKKLVDQGILFTATSLHQLTTFCKLFPGSDVSVRINPAIGDGLNNRLTTGGVNAGFGIWHEYIPQVKQIAADYGCRIIRLHTHIGSGSDPKKWEEAEAISLNLIKSFPEAEVLNLGGGFKVAYMPGETSADMTEIGLRLQTKLKKFAIETGRKIKLEIEPGRFLVAESSAIICQIIDKTDTGKNGLVFLRVNTGMNDLLRPGMYGAQHPLTIIKSDGSLPLEKEEVAVIGHNCESADMLTPYPGDPERVQPRNLGKAEIGDYLVIGVTGAYGVSMAAKEYNGYPSAKQVII